MMGSKGRKNKRSQQTEAGFVRIIAGSQRGRRIPVPSATDLRPTGDRIRETLFNWLQATVAGASCLDLFAGSGALGFESASRGASHVTLVDQNSLVAEQLRQVVGELGFANMEIHAMAAEAYLQGAGQPFDIVFLDPPFAYRGWQSLLDSLIDGDWLADRAMLYLESSPDAGVEVKRSELQLVRERSTGQVCYRLYRFERCPTGAEQ